MAIASRDTITLDELMAELDRASQAVETLPIARDLYEPIRDIVYEDITANFDNAASASGQPWTPHAPSTIAKYGPHPLLILTGKLKAASTQTGAPGNYEDVSDRQIVFGNSVIYAAAQHFGFEHIPARPYEDISEEAIGKIEEVATEYLIHEVVLG